MTSLPGVFAGGDIVRGASLVVWGVRDGRDAAAGIHAWLAAGGVAERPTWPWPREARDDEHVSTRDRACRRWRADAAHLAEHGLYDPADERDACGVGCVVAIDGQPRREVVVKGIEALKAVWHRGAVDADGKTGDGAGIHVQIPQDFFQRKIKGAVRTDQRIAVGMVFLPRASFQQQEACRTIVESEVLRFGYAIRGWRQVPVDTSVLGEKAAATRPEIEQIIIGNPKGHDEDQFERDLYLIRRRIEKQALAENITDFYICSLSCRSVIYKGLFLAESLALVLPRPAGRALRLELRAVPPALLDQHHAVLEAGAAVPRPRPQWRDQHAARQRQLDEEPRDADGRRGVRRRTTRTSSRSSSPAAPTAPPSTRSARPWSAPAASCRWSRPC